MSDQRRTPIETDPIGAIRKELVLAARRQRASRERRRRLAIFAATALVALASVACASAITDLRMGVPAVDRLLGNYERNADRDRHGQPARRPSSQLDVPPKAGSTAVAIAVPWGEEPEAAMGSLYLNRRDRLCFTFALPIQPGVEVVRGRQTGCHYPRLISRRLAEEQAFISGMTFGESTVVHGFAAPQAEVIGVTGPEGRFKVQVSDVIRLETPQAEPLRLFMAYTAASDTGDRGSGTSGSTGDPREYAVRVRLSTGDVVERAPLATDENE